MDLLDDIHSPEEFTPPAIAHGWSPAPEVTTGRRSRETVLSYGGFAGLLGAASAASGVAVRLDARDWNRGAIDPLRLDERVDRLAAGGPFHLVLAGSPGELRRARGEVALRCQRWKGRRNRASMGEGFGRVLRRHRAIHDLDRPLVRADYRHALDTWQWVLRLEPGASLAVQVAALFHDVERLDSEADERSGEAGSDDGYGAYKTRHAQASAAAAREALAEVPVLPGTARAAAELIAAHDRPGGVQGLARQRSGRPGEGELALLEDADALSFLTLNALGYRAYHGPERAVRKTAWTLRRLSRRGWRHLEGASIDPDVAALVRRATDEAVLPREEGAQEVPP
ncbi:MAG: DUF4202 family protein [Thermoanaerobaculia bacterium]